MPNRSSSAPAAEIDPQPQLQAKHEPKPQATKPESPPQTAPSDSNSLVKRGVGRPTKYSPELVEEILEGVANGSSLIKELKERDIAMVSFYRWAAKYPEVERGLDEAFGMRARTAHDRLWHLSLEVTGQNARVRRTEAELMQLSLDMSQRAINSWISRRGHQAQDTTGVLPIVDVTYGRTDKPPGWKVTDDFPEHGPVIEGKAEPSPEDRLVAERQKAEYMGGE